MLDAISKEGFSDVLCSMIEQAAVSGHHDKMKALNDAASLWVNISKRQEIIYSYTMFRAAMIHRHTNEDISYEQRKGYMQVLKSLNDVGVSYSY